MQIIPALAIKDGKAVDFQPGRPEVTLLSIDPYKIIDTLGSHSVHRVHLVDIDGAEYKGKDNIGLIGSLSNICVCDLEVGGGINNLNHLKSLQYAGVDYFVLGSVVHEKPALLEEISDLKHIKNDDIMIAVDLLDGKLTYHGYADSINDQAVHDVIVRALALGYSRVLITDIDTRHPDHGPDIAFLSVLVQEFPSVKFSVAGHIHTFDQVDRLKEVGIKEVVVGYDFYADTERIKALSAYNNKEERES